MIIRRAFYSFFLVLLCLSYYMIEGKSNDSSLLQQQQQAHRRLGELDCDLDLYNDFLSSIEGQDIFIMATLCESRIQYLKTRLAGGYGPVEQVHLKEVMCSEECLKSDELHQMAMSKSRCTCAQVSEETFVKYDFCLQNSARMLCTHLGECGHWSCPLEDFMCQRYEWDRFNTCDAIGLRESFAMVLFCWILLYLSHD